MAIIRQIMASLLSGSKVDTSQNNFGSKVRLATAKAWQVSPHGPCIYERNLSKMLNRVGFGNKEKHEYVSNNTKHLSWTRIKSILESFSEHYLLVNLVLMFYLFLMIHGFSRYIIPSSSWHYIAPPIKWKDVFHNVRHVQPFLHDRAPSNVVTFVQTLEWRI